MPTPLTPARRSELRGEAHKLKPVVMIGDKKGLSDEVVAEIERALKAHELVKVKAATDDRAARESWLAAICERLAAHPVQQIGKCSCSAERQRPPPKPRAGGGARKAHGGRKRPPKGVRSKPGPLEERAKRPKGDGLHWYFTSTISNSFPARRPTPKRRPSTSR